ncbi:MAG: zinc-binding dehydrogenase [Oscillospiraceae bacterium]
MKAVVWVGRDKLDFREVPEPACLPGQVKIKVMSAGVCMTDVHIITGKFAAGEPPHILGHEIAGEVAEVGNGCGDIALGDRVVVETAIGCGICHHCRTANKHLCDRGGEIGYPPYQGGYAQYVCVPRGCVYKLPDNVGYDAAGIMEAVACPFGAVERVGMSMGSSVLIQGPGIAGLSFVQAARAHGAGKIIVTGTKPFRLEKARELGADVAIDVAKEDVASRVLDETAGEGADLSIDTVGSEASIRLAAELARKNGKVVLYGIPNGDATLTYPVQRMILNQLTVYGVTNNELIWQPLLTLLEKGTVRIDDMVTHRFPLRELRSAVDLLLERPEHLIKAVVHPWP